MWFTIWRFHIGWKHGIHQSLFWILWFVCGLSGEETTSKAIRRGHIGTMSGNRGWNGRKKLTLDTHIDMDVSLNGGTPKSSIKNRVFHYKPSILGYPYYWKHPYNNLYFSELFQLAQHNAHSKIVSRNRADIKKPGESSEEEEEVLKAVPKASQSMVLPKAKIARQIGCGSLVVRVFSFFFKSMLKAILVNRAETPKKWMVWWYDGMMVWFHSSRAANWWYILIIEHLDGIPATPWITSELRDSEDDEDSDCKSASYHWQPYNTTAQNPFGQKTVFFLKMKWCLYLQDIERAMKKAAAEAATLAEKIHSSWWVYDVLYSQCDYIKIIKMFRSFGTCTVLHHPSSQFVHLIFHLSPWGTSASSSR